MCIVFMKPEATMNRTVEYKADTKMKQYTLSKCIVNRDEHVRPWSEHARSPDDPTGDPPRRPQRTQATANTASVTQLSSDVTFEIQTFICIIRNPSVVATVARNAKRGVRGPPGSRHDPHRR